MPLLTVALALLILPVLGCAAPADAEPLFTLELLSTDPAEQVDSLPPPRVEVSEGRLQVTAVFGLGAAGYVLTPVGTVTEGMIDLVVTARMPEETMGLTVLTTYTYRVTSDRLPAGGYRVRLRHAMDGMGAPETVVEETISIER